MNKVTVKVQLYVTLRDTYQTKELLVTCNGTIKDLIVSLSNILGQQFYSHVYDDAQEKIRDTFYFSVNGRNIKDLHGDPRVTENDNISIFPPVGGGQQQWIQGSYMK